MEHDNQLVAIFVAHTSDTELATPDRTIIDRFRKSNENRINIVFTESPDSADIVVLFEQFSFKLRDYAKKLSSDSFFSEWASKIYVVNYDDTVGTGFLPGCYVSVPRSRFDRRWHRACAYPKTYNAVVSGRSIPDGFSPAYSFSFVGTLRSHPVRRRIYDLHSGHPKAVLRYVDQDFHSHDEEQKQQYVDDILNSRFVLCPRGHSPATYRLFEVLRLGRCPVIISDEWMPTDGVTWSECSIMIPEDRVQDIPSVLADRSDQAEQIGIKARDIWEARFSEIEKNRFYADSIVSLHQQRLKSGEIWTAQRYCERWSSFEFLRRNQWTLFQRLMRRASKRKSSY